MYEIYVTNLPFGVDEEDIWNWISLSIKKFPSSYEIEIYSIRRSHGIEVGRFPGSCFIQVNEKETAENLVSCLARTSFGRHTVSVKLTMEEGRPSRERRQNTRRDYRELDEEDARRDDRRYNPGNRASVYPSQFKEGIVDAVGRKNGGRCYICGKKIAPHELSIDHVAPCAELFNRFEYQYPYEERVKSYNDINNLMPVHKRCNSSKGSYGREYESGKIQFATTPYHIENGKLNWRATVSERDSFKEGYIRTELQKCRENIHKI